MEVNEKIEIKTDPNTNQELLESKILLCQLNDAVANLAKEKEQLENTLVNKNEEIRNLEMADKAKKEACVKLNKELKDLRLKCNQEKTDILKSHKHEVKCWRKELGEEKKVRLKLEKKLEVLETYERSNIITSEKKLPKKNTTKKMESCENSEKTFCSICSIELPCYNCQVQSCLSKLPIQ